MVATSRFVSCDEMSFDMTEDEYALFIERFESRGYSNHADLNSDGSPVDVFENILSGMRILEELGVGD